jgi:L-fuculose-phosphate aldolase
MLIDIRFMNPRQALVSTIIRRAVLECLAAQDKAPILSEDPVQLFDSPPAITIKEEIIRTGRKLWERQYVDGNGGNISARLSENYVVCTPTLCSKGDMRIEDLSLIDMENRQIIGSRPQSSEMLLHLEIYKAVPIAQSVIHCHPPYATAHAIAGVIPVGNLVPEQEVFVGPVALTPYETPGTMEFARTIHPVVRQHNTILLANHGVVCWADTVTHAEWYIEVVDTYCKTVMIASQLKSPLPEIPSNKIADLLAIKERLGLPDARIPIKPDLLSEGLAELKGAAVDRSDAADCHPRPTQEEIDELVSVLSAQILPLIEKGA